MTDRRAIAQLRRLMRWLEAFKECFGHRAQQVALRRYVQGLLSDSARKSMEAMLARVTEPGSYQAFQHFITDAPWRADQVWRRLRAVLPEREGLLIIDGTSVPKQGDYSVGVGRQYCGALGKVANCQVAVTAALWTGLRGYLVGAALYLQEAWLTDAARDRARDSCQRPLSGEVAPGPDVAPPGCARAASPSRACWRMRNLGTTACFAPTCIGWASRMRSASRRRRPSLRGGRASCRRRARGWDVRAPDRPWPPARRRPPSPPLPRGSRGGGASGWRNRGAARQWTVECAALRVTPAHDWRHRRLAPEVWLLAERDVGETPQTKYFFVHLPATASWRQLVRLAHQRWAIEQQYRELKTDLGLEHFEGRTFPGWHHHVVLTAIAYNFLQAERRRHLAGLTFPAARAIVQEIFTAYVFAQRPHYLKRIEALRSVKLQI